MEFKVGDTVVIYNSTIAEITYIDHKDETADVEWDECLAYTNCACIPLKNLIFVARKEN